MQARRRSLYSCRGAVLAEVIMMAVVTGLLLSVTSAFFVGYVKLWQRETGRLGAVKRADFALRRMQKEIRNARRVTISPGGTSMSLTLPRQHYDAQLARMLNDLDSQGQLVDGDSVRYFLVLGSYTTGSAGNSICRRIVLANGTEMPYQHVVDHIYPELNPLAAGASTPRPIYSYDSSLRTAAVTVTAAEPRPSAATFLVRNAEARCKRDGGHLVRAVTAGHPEGEIHCDICGSAVRPSAEIVTYQMQLLVRNQ